VRALVVSSFSRPPRHPPALISTRWANLAGLSQTRARPMDIFTGLPSVSMTVAQPADLNSAVLLARQMTQSLRLGADDAEAILAIVLQWGGQMSSGEGGILHLRELDGDACGLEVVATHRDAFHWSLPRSLPAHVRFDQWIGPQGGAALARVGPAGLAVDGRFGAAQHAFRQDPFCGDAWAVAVGSSGVTALVIDGLGHGPVANMAAVAGIEAFSADPGQPLGSVAQALHVGMARTCGGVAALGHFNPADLHLSFVGAGDVSGRLIGLDGTSRGLASQPGTFGVRLPPLRVLPYQADAHLLVLHSDGVRDRWRLQDYPGLRLRHPALIAAILHRDFGRDSDDGTILVVDLDAF